MHNKRTEDIMEKIHEMEEYIRKKENVLNFMKQSLLKNLIYKSGLEEGCVIKKGNTNHVIKDFKLTYCLINNKYELAAELAELNNLHTITKESNIIHTFKIKTNTFEIIGKYNFKENQFVGNYDAK